MSWQDSVAAAIRDLRREEVALQKDLQAVKKKIDELSTLAKSEGPRARSRRSGAAARKPRLSPTGREAISKAAKKRWAKYRSDKKRQRR